MAAIFGLSARSTLPKPRNISGELFSVMGHFGAYFALAVALWWMLGLFRLSSRTRMAIAWAGAVFYGFTDEFHQSFVPGRTPDIRDIVTDAVGAAAGLLVVALILHRWQRA